MNKNPPNFRSRLSQQGQVLVEYLLLMVIAVSCATILTTQLVGRGDGKKQGMIIKAWDKILKTIGNDLPDCKQPNYATANCPP